MIRLDKLLAHSGYGSRKDVKNLIRKGYVCVNEEIILDDDYKVNEDIDEITILDETVEFNKLVYLMLHKPQDVISATFDNRYKTVIDLVDTYGNQNVFPVGRLDIDTEGLLLITNDGKLAHKLLSPKKHVDKVYYVEHTGKFFEAYHKIFADGITIDDGYTCLPAKFEVLGEGSGNITIHEGKFHQVKRMFESLNMKVTYLKRIKFGSLALDKDLPIGEYRHLTVEEIAELREDVM